MAKQVHLWSDGSAINNGEGKGFGGYGYVLLYGDFSDLTDEELKTKYCDDKYMLTGYKGFTDTTNQKEEIRSIAEGLKRLNTHDVPVQVFSDSAYVVNCMNQRWFDGWRANGWKNAKKQPVANQEQWENLLHVIEDNMLFVKFNKIKGHSKVYYNEMADVVANKGLDEVRGEKVKGEGSDED